jgi:hypothetical protein
MLMMRKAPLDYLNYIWQAAPKSNGSTIVHHFYDFGKNVTAEEMTRFSRSLREAGI